MKEPMRYGHVAALLALTLMMTWVSVGRAEDFYENQLHLGIELFREEQFVQASNHIRVACFGLLDRPALLSEGLVWLSLAQAAADMPDLKTTVTRFVDLERRFAVYRHAAEKLEPQLRTRFESLLIQRVASATLAAIPSLSPLLQTAEAAPVPPKEQSSRRKRLEAAIRKRPNDVKLMVELAREASQRDDYRATLEWAERALSIDPANREAISLKERAAMANSRAY